MSKIKVFIVDDSVMVRSLFSQVINDNKEMEVVGVAGDPIMAERKMSNLEVDVIVLDVEMPKMNGLDYLKQIMSTNPKPVIMCSSMVENNKSSEAIKAMSLGASDIIGKNNSKIKEFVTNSSNRLIMAILKAAKSNPSKGTSTSSSRQNPQSLQSTTKINSTAPTGFKKSLFSSSTIVAIGSSTGGVQIIESILTKLPENCPPILIVQHMPASFVASMANRINAICTITVKEASQGELVEPNTAYISPGDIHMNIKKIGTQYQINLIDGEKVSHHKPSVDVLFNSFAKEVLGSNIKAFILTGMGYDGAAGIHAIKKQGGKTYAQDEKSCTVYGMPKEAVKLGAIDRILTPSEMVDYIVGR